MENKEPETKITCLNRCVGRCQGCSEDYNPEHHPNNLGCPNYTQVTLFLFKVESKKPQQDSLEKIAA